MAVDRKYGKVTFEKGDIGEDEPVFVFRARDATVPDLLAEYWWLCDNAGSPQHHLDAIRDAKTDIEKWQKDNPDQVRIPQSSALAPKSDD